MVYRGGSGGGRRVEILEQSSSEVDDRSRRIDGNARKKGEVLATMCVSGEVGNGRVG